MNSRNSLLLTLIILFIGSSSPYLAKAQSLQDKFEKMMQAQFPSDGPGATVLVAKGDEVIFSGAYGKANLELDIDNAVDQVFEIGSITKQFTAVGILMLMEDGKLQLEDDITKFINDYPTHGHSITIHHLLTHTSGIKSYTSMPSFFEHARKDMSPEELIDVFKNEPMDFAPGEQWLYNNSAYILLGHIIESLSEMAYEDFVQQKIFDPLDMTSTYYGSQSRIIKNRSYGYQHKDNLVNADYLSLTLPYAAGSIMSTVGDLYIWQSAIKTNKLISAESLKLATMDHPLNNGEKTGYGYGWGVNMINGSPTYEHSGGIFGYNSNGIYLPNEDVYVAVLSNSDFISTGEISTRIAALTIGKPYPDPTERITLDKEYMKSLVGVYEYEEGVVRTITLENGQLMSQRKGSQKIPIHAIDKNAFIFENSLSTLVLETTAEGNVKAHFKNRNSESRGFKTDKKIEKKKEIKVSNETLSQYAGKYELQPGFVITVTVEEGRLMTQATRQPKFEVFAETKTKFFLKMIDANIEFVKNTNGAYDTLVLNQGDLKMEGKRIK